MKKIEVGKLYKIRGTDKVIRIRSIEGKVVYFKEVKPKKNDLVMQFAVTPRFIHQIEPYIEEEQIEVGDIVRIKTDLKIKELDSFVRAFVNIHGLSKEYKVVEVNEEYIVVKINSWCNSISHPLTKNMFEIVRKEKKEILDKEEKEYLKAFLRPYGRNTTITKRKFVNREYLEFEVCKIEGEDYHYSKFELPTFTVNTMYRGMESEKKYTLNELGL